jgi:hypothetical protein
MDHMLSLKLDLALFYISIERLLTFLTSYQFNHLSSKRRERIKPTQHVRIDR